MLRVLKPGFYTTIQDIGRFGFRDLGVPISGCMDDLAREKGNLLLENEIDAPVLEMTMTGPSLLFDAPTFICLTGADMSPTLNEVSIIRYKVYRVDKGDTLEFGKLMSGLRAYLAVKNGFDVEKVLGSSSQYGLITDKAFMDKNEDVPYKMTKAFAPKITEMKIEDYYETNEILVNKGPEFELFSEAHREKLLSQEFTIAKENNRMAYQLKETIGEHQINRLTSATLPGTVQLTPSGKLIILMKDGQTTGGYPRVLQLAEKSISILAQKRMGDSIRFKL